MQNSFDGNFYDEDYFERGRETGKSWLENYHWMPRRSFREAFAFIDILSLDEKSKVLEFGCAKGFLVRAMRTLGIPTDGCDISKYALSFAPPGCWNCSHPRSWEGRYYTHIIIKDVLEHLTAEQLHKQLQLFATVSSKIMCVVPLGDRGKYRIPEYHRDVSHVLAEDELWWSSSFGKADWVVTKFFYHVPGLKDNWFHVKDGNGVFVLEKYDYVRSNR